MKTRRVTILVWLMIVGTTSSALVEFVDVYPTLADIRGLDAPKGVEGVSLKPLLSKPDLPWKRAVFSQYPRARSGHRHRGRGDIMGYAVRTHRYRYVEWRDWDSKQVLARELYDHDSDPHETRNVAAQRECAEVIRDLAGLLESGWKSVLPGTAEAVEQKQPESNVLFLAVDDMKDWVNCLGGYEGKVYTPNIDRLAKRGMLFTNAHCASPKCAPSRAAIMSY